MRRGRLPRRKYRRDASEAIRRIPRIGDLIWSRTSLWLIISAWNRRAGKQRFPDTRFFIDPDVAASPWPVPTVEHTAAIARWNSGRKRSQTPKNNNFFR